MDAASKAERMKAQGFDPTDVQYHGTEADITSFIPSTSGKMGPAHTHAKPIDGQHLFRLSKPIRRRRQRNAATNAR